MQFEGALKAITEGFARVKALPHFSPEAIDAALAIGTADEFISKRCTQMRAAPKFKLRAPFYIHDERQYEMIRFAQELFEHNLHPFPSNDFYIEATIANETFEIDYAVFTRYSPTTRDIAIGVVQRPKELGWYFVGIEESNTDGLDREPKVTESIEMRKHRVKHGDDAADTFYLIARRLVLYTCALLATKGVERIPTTVEPSVQAKRIAQGRAPLPEYVTLKLPKVNYATGHKGGTHASPIPHWRRGHVRHLPNGKVTMVEACFVNSTLAVAPRDYKVVTATPSKAV
jgi:hypothetical protein